MISFALGDPFPPVSSAQINFRDPSNRSLKSRTATGSAIPNWHCELSIKKGMEGGAPTLFLLTKKSCAAERKIPYATGRMKHRIIFNLLYVQASRNVRPGISDSRSNQNHDSRWGVYQGQSSSSRPEHRTDEGTRHPLGRAKAFGVSQVERYKSARRTARRCCGQDSDPTITEVNSLATMLNGHRLSVCANCIAD